MICYDSPRKLTQYDTCFASFDLQLSYGVCIIPSLLIGKCRWKEIKKSKSIVEKPDLALLDSQVHVLHPLDHTAFIQGVVWLSKNIFSPNLPYLPD